MKAYWESGGIAPRIILPRHYIEVTGQLHAPAALPKRKSPWYQLDRRLGGPQNRFGCGGEQKNFQPLPGLETPISQPVAQCYTFTFIIYSVRLVLLVGMQSIQYRWNYLTFRSIVYGFTWSQ
jgi:hypothetical protein